MNSILDQNLILEGKKVIVRVDLNVPMELDAKIGPNWLETYEVDLHC